MKRISSLQGDRTHPAYLISRPAKCLFFFLFFLHTQPTFAAWDSNSNGMSDLWEKQFNNNQLFPNAAPYQLADDPDRDGWNNEKEAIAGTDPFNANAPDGFVTPEIVQELAPGTFTLTWPSIPGKTYQLQTSETLQQGSWLDFSDALLGDGDPIIKLLENQASNSNTPPRLFYHVAINDIDQDDDGLTDAEEYQLGTHPTLADSDTDGLSDRAELLAGLYPNNPDCDLDGILDGADFTPLVNNAIANPDGAGLDPSYETNLIGRWDFEKSVTNSNDTLLESSTPATVGAFDISGTSAIWDGRQGGIYNSTGMPSSAVQFSKVGAFGKLPGTIFDNKNTETWCMWIKFPTAALDGSNGRRTLFSMGKYKNAMNDFGLPYLHAYFNGLDETLNLDTYWISGNNFNCTGLANWPTPASLDDGKFHHLAITFRPDDNFGKYELYYDGELVSELHSNKLPSLSFSQSGSEPYAYIGRMRTMATANEEPLGATIDRLRIYQTRLTAASVLALYNQDIDRDQLWDITEYQTRYSDYASSVIYHPVPGAPNTPQPTQTGYARSPFLYGSGTLDFDQDELNDLAEQSAGTNLAKPDTDDDNLLDGFEVTNQLNPLNAYSLGATKPRDDLGDPDADGLTTFTEYLNGSNPHNANTDGDSKSDAAEITQGSNPANAADSGAAPSDPPVSVPFHIFGDYTAWEATIKGKGPNDTRTRRFQMSAHNVATNPNLPLLRGNAYELSLRYIRTKPGETVPWYCWEATIDGKNTSAFKLADHWVVDNSSSLLAQHTHSHGSNLVADKKVSLLPVDLAVDTDRNGIVSPGSDQVGEDQWTDQLGAIYGVNFDRDGDLNHNSKPAADAITWWDTEGVPFHEDWKINGQSDESDITPLVITIPQLPDGSKAYLVAGEAEDVRAIHLFSRIKADKQAIWGGFLDAGKPWTDNDSNPLDIEISQWLNASADDPTSTATGIKEGTYTFGIEGLLFRGMKVPGGTLPEGAGKFSGVIDLELELAIPGNTERLKCDKVRMKVAPFLLTPNNRPTDHVYVMDTPGGLQSIPKSLPVASGAPSQWLQDHAEIGYTQRPGGPVMKIAFVCPWEGQLAEWPRTLLLAPGKGVFALGKNLGGSGGDYGGNIELSHPQEGYPIGRILAGSTMGAKLKLFLEAQEKQKPIIADISYTDVQHIDEVLSPGPAEATYIADPAGAVALLREKFNTAEKQLRGVLFSPDTQRPGLATIWKTAANGIPFIITNLDYDAVIQEWNRFRPTETGGAGGYVRIVGGSSGGQIGIIKNISKATQADANRIGFAGNPAGKMMLEIQYYYDTGSKASANWKVAAPHRASGWYRPPTEGASVVCVEKTLRWGSTTPAIITVKEILEDAAFVAFNETTRPPLIQATAAAAGVSQPTKLPCLFYMHTELGRTFGVAFTPNTANLQWVDSNPCSAQAFGPRDENNKDVLEEGIRSTLPGTSSFIDDWSLYHIRMGEIHCGSSAERLGESSWWKK